MPAPSVPRVPPWKAASCCCNSSTPSTPPRPPCPVPRAGPAPGSCSVDPVLLGDSQGPPPSPACALSPTAGGGSVSPSCLGGAGGQGPPCSPLCQGGGPGLFPPGPSGICINLGFLIKLRFVFLSSLLLSWCPSASLPPLSVVVLDPHCSSPSCPCPCPPLSPLTPHVTPAPGDSEGGGVSTLH